MKESTLEEGAQEDLEGVREKIFGKCGELNEVLEETKYGNVERDISKKKSLSGKRKGSKSSQEIRDS